jgi:4-amino-4-deoxy-L-arabinose transferase-like glycosyltransferase
LRLAIQSRHFWIAALIAILIAAPWHILMYAWYGRAFIDEYIGYHVIARSTRTLEGHPSSYLYFLVKLLDGFFPWILLTPFALVAFVRDRVRGRLQPWILLVLVALVFGLYTLIPTRRAWYIVPMYPALSIIISAFLVRLYENLQTRPVSRRLIAAGYAILIIAGAAYTLVSVSLNHKPLEPIAKLSRLAQATTLTDKEPLLLFSEAEPFYAQVPVFYSDRPIQQTYVSFKPATEDAPRYVNYGNLFDVTGNSVNRIIFRKEETARLTSQYDVRILAEDGPLVYAMIQRRSAVSTRQ